jgi:TPR repeat protein
VPRDAARAATLQGQACSYGDARGCVALARLFLPGSGARPEPARAVALLEQGCTLRSLTACSMLAGILERGELASRDLGRARSLYVKTCDGGLAGDCYSLAHLVQRAQGARNVAAFDLLGRGCNGGSTPACRELASLYGSREPEKALVYYRKACAAGDAPACAEARKIRR